MKQSKHKGDGKGQTVVYLVRHAEYQNPRHVYPGRLPGFPLSPKGKKQALRLAKILGDKPIAAIYCSPLSRARETATILGRHFHLTPVVDRGLIEIGSAFDGKPLGELKAPSFNFYRRQYVAAGGETLGEIFARIDSTIRRRVRQHRGQSLLLVSHGDPLMSVWAKYTGKRLTAANVHGRAYVAPGAGFAITFGETGRHPWLRQIRPR